ncbi:MAG: formate dehydrogenase subunit delta [Proteobacteria bacterium]|nr:formate dehydrogenase subunit delta [Pseudomonadota bacterium]
MNTDTNLIRMANQIADNFAYLEVTQAAEKTADHLRRFWSPEMRARAVAMWVRDQSAFNEITCAALEMLAP